MLNMLFNSQPWESAPISRWYLVWSHRGLFIMLYSLLRGIEQTLCSIEYYLILKRTSKW